MKKIFKMLNGEIIIGTISAVQGEPDVFVENPWTVKSGNLMPYMMDELQTALPALQIHPMNILWAAPLEDFKEIERIYVEKTSGIIF